MNIDRHCNREYAASDHVTSPILHVHVNARNELCSLKRQLHVDLRRCLYLIPYLIPTTNTDVHLRKLTVEFNCNLLYICRFKCGSLLV